MGVTIHKVIELLICQCPTELVKQVLIFVTLCQSDLFIDLGKNPPRFLEPSSLVLVSSDLIQIFSLAIYTLCYSLVFQGLVFTKKSTEAYGF